MITSVPDIIKSSQGMVATFEYSTFIYMCNEILTLLKAEVSM